MLTDSFILSFSNYWNFDLECKRGKQKVAFWAWKVTRTFEKQAPVPQVLLPFFPLLPGGVLSLSTLSKSNAWDFHLIMTRISENIPATSEDLWQFSEASEHCWNYLKMFQPPLSSSEAISKGKILVCCDTVGHKYFQGNWTARLLLIMC